MNSTPSAFLPTVHGNFQIYSFPNMDMPYAPDLALVAGDLDLSAPVLLRIHSECLTGDVFGSLRCDCGIQLHSAMERMGSEGGLLLYMRQEGRGIGLHQKIEAYRKQDEGLDTVEANYELGYEADERDYKKAVSILKNLGILQVRLMTNNPKKVQSLQQDGILVIDRIPLVIPANKYNDKYLNTKRDKLGHLLP